MCKLSHLELAVMKRFHIFKSRNLVYCREMLSWFEFAIRTREKEEKPEKRFPRISLKT